MFSAGSFLAIIFFISHSSTARLDTQTRERTSSRSLLGATGCSSNRSSLIALIDGVCDEGSAEGGDDNYVACLKKRFSSCSDYFTFHSSYSLSGSNSTICKESKHTQDKLQQSLKCLRNTRESRTDCSEKCIDEAEDGAED